VKLIYQFFGVRGKARIDWKLRVMLIVAVYARNAFYGGLALEQDVLLMTKLLRLLALLG